MIFKIVPRLRLNRGTILGVPFSGRLGTPNPDTRFCTTHFHSFSTHVFYSLCSHFLCSHFLFTSTHFTPFTPITRPTTSHSPHPLLLLLLLLCYGAHLVFSSGTVSSRSTRRAEHAPSGARAERSTRRAEHSTEAAQKLCGSSAHPQLRSTLQKLAHSPIQRFFTLVM